MRLFFCLVIFLVLVLAQTTPTHHKQQLKSHIKRRERFSHVGKRILEKSGEFDSDGELTGNKEAHDDDKEYSDFSISKETDVHQEKSQENISRANDYEDPHDIDIPAIENDKVDTSNSVDSHIPVSDEIEAVKNVDHVEVPLTETVVNDNIHIPVSDEIGAVKNEDHIETETIQGASHISSSDEIVNNEYHHEIPVTNTILVTSIANEINKVDHNSDNDDSESEFSFAKEDDYQEDQHAGYNEHTEDTEDTFDEIENAHDQVIVDEPKFVVDAPKVVVVEDNHGQDVIHEDSFLDDDDGFDDQEIENSDSDDGFDKNEVVDDNDHVNNEVHVESKDDSIEIESEIESEIDSENVDDHIETVTVITTTTTSEPTITTSEPTIITSEPKIITTEPTIITTEPAAQTTQTAQKASYSPYFGGGLYGGLYGGESQQFLTYYLMQTQRQMFMMMMMFSFMLGGL